MTVDLVSKDGRQVCWDARDKFWHCLDLNNEDRLKCLKERESFEKNCSKTWVRLSRFRKFLICNYCNNVY